jgi:hypothetical protein
MGNERFPVGQTCPRAIATTIRREQHVPVKHAEGPESSRPGSRAGLGAVREPMAEAAHVADDLPTAAAIATTDGLRSARPATVLRLQRQAGNGATTALIRREGTAARRALAARQDRSLQRAVDDALAPGGPQAVQRLASLPGVQRDGEGVNVTHKRVFNTPELKPKQPRDLGYVQWTPSLAGSLEVEISPPASPSAATPGGKTSTPPPVPASAPVQGPGTKPLASPGGAKVNASSGVASDLKEDVVQAEVGLEWEKRQGGLLDNMAPKVKIGGEANANKAKVGLEMSLEGQYLEPKFGFTLLGAEGDEIKFATLEVGLDVKIHSWEIPLSDGSTAKVTPKVLLKIAIEPNYSRIFTYLVEQGGAAVAAEALVAGGIIFAGAFSIVGFILTLGDGAAYAKAIDDAADARKSLIAGFVAGATGAENSGDEWTKRGWAFGDQWRNQVRAGGRSGIPVPLGVIDVKAKESQEAIRKSAESTANQVIHNALVLRYWEIHYIERYVPWEEIDTIYSMLMEGQGFGKPEPQEGKNAKPEEGAGTLPS